MKIVVLFCVIAFTGIRANPRGQDRNQLTEVFHWDIINFEIPENRREQALASGSYIPSKNGIIQLGVWRDKMFVGLFRLSTGVLSSLNYFSLNTTDKSPVLIPYPSFEANYVNEDPISRTESLPSPSSVINSGHFYVDNKCDRLWVLDSGYTEHFGNRRRVAQPALVIFDLTTDTLIRRIEIPQKFLNPLSTLSTIVVDFEGDSCEDVHAYISDLFRSIIVYSFKTDRTWQVEHNFMGSDPLEGNFAYEHFKYQWNYGVYSLAIGGKQPDGSKPVYFAPLSSTKVYSVSNRVLQDENYTLNKYYDDFHLLGETGKSNHANQMAYDDVTGSLFNTIFGGARVGCWNTRLPYQSTSTVHKTSTDFFPVGLHIDTNRNLWVVSDLVPFASYAEFSKGRKNVRIFKENVDQAIAGTNCKSKKS